MTTAGVNTRTTISAYARSYGYVANEDMRLMQDAIAARGLSMDYLHEHFETIERGLRTWLLDRDLKAVYLEIFNTSTDKVVERLDLLHAYSAELGEERFETQIERVRAALTEDPALPPGCRYRVLVDLETGAKPVPGWGQAVLRNADNLRRRDVGNAIGTAAVNVEMVIWR